MKITVFGSTGTIGQQVIQQAIAAGHEVIAFARTPEKLSTSSPSLKVVQGDVLTDHDQIDRAVAGADAVVVALGAGARGKVRSVGTQNIIASMKRMKVRSLICQSTLGAGDSVKQLNLKWWLIFRGPLRWAMADHERQENLVRDSGLDWTIVRPSAFTDGPQTGTYQRGKKLDKKHSTLTISRADVAHFLLSEAAQPSYQFQSVSLSS